MGLGEAYSNAANFGNMIDKPIKISEAKQKSIIR